MKKKSKRGTKNLSSLKHKENPKVDKKNFLELIRRSATPSKK